MKKPKPKASATKPMRLAELCEDCLTERYKARTGFCMQGACTCCGRVMAIAVACELPQPTLELRPAESN